MQKKFVIMIFGLVTGLVGAASVGQYPKYAGQIQVGLYSIIVLGLLLIGFWSDRRRQRFWQAIGLVVLLHAALLISMRSLFPFKTILVLIPIAIMECVVAATLFLLAVGY